MEGGTGGGASWKERELSSDAGASLPLWAPLSPLVGHVAVAFTEAEHLALESFNNSHTMCSWVALITFLGLGSPAIIIRVSTA